MMQARMRQAYLLAVVVVASVVLLAGTAFAQTNIGTWKLNLAKSKYNAGTAPKSQTIKYEAAGAGIKTTVDAVAADGAVSHYTYTANYDGKDYPVVGNSANGDAISRTRVNATTTTGVNKKGGKVTTTGAYVVSSDGKTLTITSKGKDALGKPVDAVAVYDKQ